MQTEFTLPLTTDVFGCQDPFFRKEVGEYPTLMEQDASKAQFDARAKTLIQRRFRQDILVSQTLKEKYRKPLIGSMNMYDALRHLGECIDETDTELYCVSQLVHSLQVVEGMERAGITDSCLLIAALIHDLGKITALYGEAPEYVNGPNEPLGGDNRPGCGLDNATFTWNHDEFVFDRVKDHVPDHVAWLVRYHSLRFDRAAEFMDGRDHDYYAQYLRVFRRFDCGTKSVFALPTKQLKDYRGLIEEYFPRDLPI